MNNVQFIEHTPHLIQDVTNTVSQCQRHQLCQPKYQVHQPKYQVHQPKYKVHQPKYQVHQPKIYAVLSQGNFCRKFTHFFGVPFTRLKNMVVYQK